MILEVSTSDERLHHKTRVELAVLLPVPNPQCYSPTVFSLYGSKPLLNIPINERFTTEFRIEANPSFSLTPTSRPFTWHHSWN